ncbi:diaminopimelate decarboxylase [Kiloniella laminariae]|uniref:Diaminopimelate decarboxylase n=1 Tax=Kiloniella laminariae TaxID=454162 RepID=A0ABT4LKK8_9PROT|nr:diaminopimelate decarboxylase [Kiloniella laminariae]MCZ4281647.1 diaminopimelate decarboxylase [Kiloniella laminariae]
MSSFEYRNGKLHVEDLPLEDIAREVGTPFFCYSTAAMVNAYNAFASALKDAGVKGTIFYALKANSNQSVISTLAAAGAGADVVSEGELRRALAAGIDPKKIVFAGVGKKPEEMALGLKVGILQFNVESLPELEALSEVAQKMGVVAPIAFRINPDVDAKTHAKISTGKAENKFGIDIPRVRKFIERANDLPNIAIESLAVHIGSQLTDASPFKDAFERLAGLYSELKQAGLPLKRIDFGGGLGIQYNDETPPDLSVYAKTVSEVVQGLDAECIFEPGRFLVGNAGVLVTETIYVKEGSNRRFVIIDAAMNDLIRPSLYDAWHDITPLQEPGADTEISPCDVVGPICESGDTFARQRPLPPVKAGDLLAMESAGAYGAVMASSYNSRLNAPEVLVKGDKFAVVRKRIDYDTLIGQDLLPEWLSS